MRHRVRIAALTLMLVAIPTFPAAAGVPPGGARLEGLLLAVDGRPAVGYTVHLVDDRGAQAGSAVSGADGLYAFHGLEAGRYAMGVELPGGRVAPVAAPPVKLGARELARRDVKLLEAGPEEARAASGIHYGFGMWWAGLTPSAKAWTIVGMVAVAAVTAAALADDDDDLPASPYQP